MSTSVRPHQRADPAFISALAEIAARIAGPLATADRTQLPVTMYLAGGAATHYYTGARFTDDVDAVFSARLVLPQDLEVHYINARGEPRLLYFDRQYNDSFALMHENARDDARALHILGVDKQVLDVRALAPVDLAVSKISRFEENDRRDIESLAQTDLITANAVRDRANDALAGYVGNVARVKLSIDLAYQLIHDATRPAKRAPRIRR